jgi:hypothetical protein
MGAAYQWGHRRLSVHKGGQAIVGTAGVGCQPIPRINPRHQPHPEPAAPPSEIEAVGRCAGRLPLEECSDIWRGLMW